MLTTEQVRWLAARLRASRLPLLLVMAGGVVTAFLAVVASWATGMALDEALKRGVGAGPLLALGGTLLASQLIRALVLYLRQLASIRLGTALERDLRSELVTGVLTDARPGDRSVRLSTLISDVRAVRYMITPGVDVGVAACAFVVVVLGSAVIWSPQLVLAPALYAIGFAWVSVRMLRGISRAARTTRAQSADMTERVTEALQNIEAVRDAGGPDAVWGRLRASASAHRDAVVGQGREERRTPLFLLLGVVQGIGFAHALLLARDGRLTVGDMVGYHSLLLLLGGPTFSAGAAYPALANGLAAIARIHQLFTGLRPADGGSFRPDADVPQLEAVDAVPAEGRQLPPRIAVTLPPRSLAVVTGPTGSGKSTLLQMLAGVEAPAAGSVRIGGVDATEWRREDLARRVVLVAEHDALFSMSLAENIGLGRLGAEGEEIRAAAGQAGVAEFVPALPDGWDARLGTGGAALSGGQRQRVALSRALLSRADVLLLDDPFSALDAGVARRLAAELIEVARHRTVVVVSDRADLRARASHILHLDDSQLTVHIPELRGT
ncbi:ABC transporter ATP-binding protein/permease [Kitasatospora sp. NBC_00085]|uniref:ATP-binding cassette domain-containing protein n=1 Tax=unclassified Kitasatospora TaxID=2633591 RepID=UPI00324C2839